ncbi:multidrug efflux MFS transporter EmrD [Plesiomonas shigelloides]|uniref:multidrug efflux MFS transporter EmrD n=1 Tax=Plesiomonas shigelloides TaxID=703 RepID=UPI0022482E4A|nr:multidrug efflux MFS transporter EmrD [Plesiomonas shigelloides]MCX2533849.1 multidrug efflux MFS transporter EmrD [Plesiomonas shigelloides]
MNKSQENKMLLLLILLVAVGQMTQTIYVPAMTQIASGLMVRPGAVQAVMAAYLLTYGLSQLVYGPLSDRFGRRPMVLSGLLVFVFGCVFALLAPSLDMLVAGSAIQGMGTGVAGVMIRTVPRDLFEGAALRRANSLISMGIIFSPLLAPVLGGVLSTHFGWRACFVFLLCLGTGVWLAMAALLPETRPEAAKNNAMGLVRSYRHLLGNADFLGYVLIMVFALAGIAVFEASAGVLMSNELGLSEVTVSILFILPLPAAFVGSWLASQKSFSLHQLMWIAVSAALLAGFSMWLCGVLGMLSVYSLLIPAAMFFFAGGMLFPLATTGALNPFPLLAGTAGALVGGLQNMGSGITTWLSASLPMHGQTTLGLLMLSMAVLIVLNWALIVWRARQHEQMLVSRRIG